MTLKSPRFALAALVAAVLAAVALAAPSGAAAQAAVAAQTAAPSTTDYDPDDDGLADITTLDQLNAVRWDLNGDGAVDAGVSAADAAKFSAAWQNAAASLGCPDTDDADANPGPCKGYELANSLDFDTDDDDDVDSSDAYPSWTPIGSPSGSPYTAEFKGNNRAISNLTISGAPMAGSAALTSVGLFGTLSATGLITGVGVVDADISAIGMPDGSRAGALAGYIQGTARASYSTGTVSAASDGAVDVGGLVGTVDGGTIAASWSSAEVSSIGHSPRAGGLAGGLGLSAAGGSIIASYASGAVAAVGVGSSSAAQAGGLIGGASGGAAVNASYAVGAVTAGGGASSAGGLCGCFSNPSISPTISFTASYWDAGAAGVADDSDSAAPEGKATSDLIAPTSYGTAGIYSAWNVNADGAAGADDPWDFGDSTQYPRLKFGGMDLAAQAIDYDADDDGLIDVKTLAQLNAIRWDWNGDGNAASDSAANYAAAFPSRDAAAGGRMGCPSGRCAGYELANDLDFDANSDGSVTAADGYSNWTPIPRYRGVFKGNNRTISNLTISGSTALNSVGLFYELASGGLIEGVGVVDANISVSMPPHPHAGALVGINKGTVRSSYATGSVNVAASEVAQCGGLVGTLDGGIIVASWADVEVSSSSTRSRTGGLAGRMSSGSVGNSYIIASYAAGSVSTSGSGWYVSAGGLVGYISTEGSSLASISSSYAAGAVSAVHTSPTLHQRAAAGGLIGVASGNYTVSDSYWDAEATGVADDSDAAAPEGKTTTQLQTPAGYTGIYANWNVDVDGAAGVDDPWDFGDSSQYPRLKRGGMSLAAQTPPTDYDDDDDRLIDVKTLAQLNAARYDLNGDGAVSSGNAANYAAAFPNRDAGAATRMGCPPPGCKGYELRADLDFDTDDDGDVDSNDAYPSWTPIGSPSGSPYTAEFKGNNRAISNLTISGVSMAGSAALTRIGLFGTLSSTGLITGVGVVDANISAVGMPNASRAGALVGYSQGTVRSSYSTGTVSAATASDVIEVGGLAGAVAGATADSVGTIAASWSSADVSSPSPSARIGGLVGWLGYSGNGGSVIASYATGSVAGAGESARAGGLIGGISGSSKDSAAASYAGGTVSAATSGGLYGGPAASAAIESSYWNADTTGIADDADAIAPEGKSASQLLSPAGYTGIYADWNIDIDNADGDGDASTGRDDPWDFGSSTQYPRLKFNGMDLAAQATDYDADDDGLIDIKTLAQLNAVRYDLNGDGDAAAGYAANYAAAFPNRPATAATRMGCPSGACTGYELMNALDFDTDGSGAVTSADAYPNWTPIGGAATPYAGAFKGNNNTISNLTISSAADRVGLFGQASGTITGVALTDASVTATAASRAAIGALVGATTGTVRGCSATGTLSHTGTGSFNDVGGLAGNSGGGTIAASWSGVSVSTAGAASSAGGLVGRTSGAVIASYATGAASASGRDGEAGGLVGI